MYYQSISFLCRWYPYQSWEHHKRRCPITRIVCLGTHVRFRATMASSSLSEPCHMAIGSSRLSK